jgi:hypothetical protein
MTIKRIVFVSFTIASAACALIAALYWFRSSLPTPATPIQITASVSDVPAQHIQSAQAGIYDLHFTLMKVSRLNKNASIWSGLAAIFGAAAAFTSM